MENELDDVESIVRSYDNSIIGHRWLATWIDFLSLFLVIAAVGATFPAIVEGWELAVVFLVALAYYLILEGLTGVTIGKLVARIRVVNQNGDRPSFCQGAIRTALRVFEVNPFIFGGVPAGLAAGYSGTRQRLGDMLAGTYVVFTKDLAKIINAQSELLNTGGSLSDENQKPNA